MGSKRLPVQLSECTKTLKLRILYKKKMQQDLSIEKLEHVFYLFCIILLINIICHIEIFC